MKKILTKSIVPFAKQGDVVITCDNGGIYKNFGSGLQLIAKVEPKELDNFVCTKAAPIQEQELVGEEFLVEFRRRMGWNETKTSPVMANGLAYSTNNNSNQNSNQNQNIHLSQNN